MRRLEAALAAAKAKKKRRRDGGSRSGYDTLNADVLTKVIEFLPLDDAAAAKQLSSTTASAARRVLTARRGQWRPFKTFCQDGDGRGCEVITLQSYTDQDRALLREVWALESGAVMKELTLWPSMTPGGQNHLIEGALRYLALVEPEPTSGFGRIAAAFAASGGLARPPFRIPTVFGDADLGPGEWARGILCQWSDRVDGDDQLHAGLANGSINLGLSAWETATDGAKFILRQTLFFGLAPGEFMDRVQHVWPDRRAAEIFVEAYEEIAEELEEIAERNADYLLQMLYDEDGLPRFE